ncbi:hypothetical protein [Limosilactobacillus vaginalis]
MNVTRQALSNWERDVNEPDLKQQIIFKTLKLELNHWITETIAGN